MSEKARPQRDDENPNTRFNVDLQYNRFAEDWRYVNTIIWQLPSIVISIMAGIVAVAFTLVEGWPRIMVLSAGSLFMFVLTIAVARQIDFANTRLRFLFAIFAVGLFYVFIVQALSVVHTEHVRITPTIVCTVQNCIVN